MKRLTVFITLFFGAAAPPSPATIIDIPDDYATIQEGIDASIDGDTVLVQPGTFVENISFDGHDIVLGSLFLTTGDTTYLAQTIIDGDSAGTVVAFPGGEDSTAMITGFTIQNGSDSYGGGISCYNSDPTIQYNVIRDNHALYGGGGIDCYVSSASVLGNRILGNSAEYWGGGIYSNGSGPLISDNLIQGNQSGSGGGGIYCRMNSNATIIANHIVGNSAHSGAGIYIFLASVAISNNVVLENQAGTGGRGGGIYNGRSASIITNDNICGNSARSGAGIYTTGDESPDIRNSIICHNSSTHSGAGIECAGKAIIINCTISGNVSGNGGGGILTWYCDPIIENSILWANLADFSYQIYAIGDPAPEIVYCDIQGGWPGEGNLDTDPLFRDSESGDYHLMSLDCEDPFDSPCIDAGHPDSLDGYLGCQWGLGTIRSDMGAYGGGDSTMVGIDIPEAAIPQRLFLFQNYPNPFNASTTIRYFLPVETEVTVEIYDILGRKVEMLMSEMKPAGSHSIVWEAQCFPSGIYFYRIETNGFDQTKKCVILK